jgi:hypothetical protein
VSAAFGGSAPAGTRARFILGGLVSVAFGVVLCSVSAVISALTGGRPVWFG